MYGVYRAAVDRLKYLFFICSCKCVTYFAEVIYHAEVCGLTFYSQVFYQVILIFYEVSSSFATKDFIVLVTFHYIYTYIYHQRNRINIQEQM